MLTTFICSTGTNSSQKRPHLLLYPVDHTYKFKIHCHVQEISNEALCKFRISPNDEEEQTGNFWWTGKRSVGAFPPEISGSMVIKSAIVRLSKMTIKASNLEEGNWIIWTCCECAVVRPPSEMKCANETSIDHWYISSLPFEPSSQEKELTSLIRSHSYQQTSFRLVFHCLTKINVHMYQKRSKLFIKWLQNF